MLFLLAQKSALFWELFPIVQEQLHHYHHAVVFRQEKEEELSKLKVIDPFWNTIFTLIYSQVKGQFTYCIRQTTCHFMTSLSYKLQIFSIDLYYEMLRNQSLFTHAAKKIHPFAFVWYEIGLLWANIMHVKSHAMVLSFYLQAYLNHIFQIRQCMLLQSKRLQK